MVSKPHTSIPFYNRLVDRYLITMYLYTRTKIYLFIVCTIQGTVLATAGNYVLVFRIKIHWMRIRIHIEWIRIKALRNENQIWIWIQTQDIHDKKFEKIQIYYWKHLHYKLATLSIYFFWTSKKDGEVPTL